ncbi:UDP-N-acetylglucosamine--N-acetylmuramyl-(pentapeptide) pyrophosphoryl-undecaprenol N-acetylglucosamine transferase [Methanomethylovorans sp.]|uniref:UDP-N-acetylglucosamine--N-acetylmuramyl- (pentapeptide) pyrophosphoryl-undecaprenol N-acetylglucosamine transferase n=1 Tax=Methanomethylovorans sp. TaxID=2758717 RepID=UPI00351C5BB1
MRTLILVCGEGLGHTSRCIAIARELVSAGHEVHFGAYSYSQELIERKGYTVSTIPSEITLVGEAGKLDLKTSIFETVKKGRFLGILVIKRLIRNVRPDVVISDGYFTGILASISMNVPAYIIMNQSNMEEFFMDRGVSGRILAKIVKKFYSGVFGIVDGIIIPDYPMPYTICRKNISFDDKLMEKVFYSGPVVGKTYGEVLPAQVLHPHVLSTIGGFGYREPLFLKVIKAAEMSPCIHYTLLAGPSVDPGKFTGLPSNVNILQFISDQFPYIKGSEVIIAPGGHSTLMETLSFGIPVLSFPDRDHTEQQNNAYVIAENALGYSLDYSTSSEDILMYLKEIIYNGKFVENTRSMRQLSEQMNGAAAICKLLESSVASSNHVLGRTSWISAPLRRTKNWARKIRAGFLQSDQKYH